MTMSVEQREDLIDAYFRALDENDPSIAESAVADDFVYDSLSGRLAGFAGLSEYITDRRSVTESDHQRTRVVHGDEASVVQGVVTGTNEDGERVEVDYCDVFEFDVDVDTISQISVYVNDA